jgi:hypothetical protein
VAWIAASVAVALLLVATALIARTAVRGRLATAAATARAGLDDTQIALIDERANAFGVESGGPFQMRGNGTLVLTPSELVFVMAVPRREVRIPRGSILLAEEARSHLGKTIGQPLLRARFTNEAGDPDSAAWAVRDLPMWLGALKR